jgi:hypothetical protein
MWYIVKPPEESLTIAIREADSYCMVDLNKDFSTFQESRAATEPAFHVKDDWRRRQYEAAKVNGDLKADGNPDTSLTDGYADVTPEDDENYEYKDDGTPRASW